MTSRGAPVEGATFPALGTNATVLVTDPAALGRAREILERELAAIDAACSRFRVDSELARVNAAAGRPVLVSPLFATALAASLRAAVITDGDVDPTCGQALVSLGYDRDFAEVARDTRRPVGTAAPLPGWRSVRLDWPEVTGGHGVVQMRRGVMLDLGATAKALAADRAAAAISETLGCGVLVNLGGDIALGGAAPSSGWRVLVTDDHAAGPGAPGQTISVTCGGIATSSTTVRTWDMAGRRVHHIVAPATGAPARSCWRTVSVAAGNCVDANTASTAAIIRAQAAPGWLADMRLPARLAGIDGAVVTVAGWPEEGTGQFDGRPTMQEKAVPPC